MMMSYKQLEVICPICGIVKLISVPEKIFSQKEFGTIKIQVPIGAVCPDHQFIVFADTKGTVRGYEKIDLHMTMPIEKTVKEKAGILTLRVLINTFGIYGVFCLMHAKVFDYPVYILLDKDSELYSLDKDLLNNVGNSLLPESYRGGEKITFIEVIDYDKIKIKDKKGLIIDSHKHILQTPWEEKLKFEEVMIKKALEIIDEEEQLKLMQQSILKLMKEMEHVKSILENVREIYEDDLIERLSKDLMIPKINHYRLNLIKNMIRNRFSPKLASKIKNKVEDFLDLL